MKRILPLMVVLLQLAPVAVWAASEGGHGEHEIPIKAIIFAAVNFLLLLLILGYFLRKPLKEFFATRAALIKKDIQDSETLKQQASEKYQEYDQRLQGIEAEMQTLLTELKEDGRLERDRMIQEAKEQVSALQETSKRVMAQELRRAKEELKQEAVNLAGELAKDLVRENITPEDQKRIVQQYLEKMEQLS